MNSYSSALSSAFSSSIRRVIVGGRTYGLKKSRRWTRCSASAAAVTSNVPA